MTDLAIYQAYPRHIGRLAALKAISKAVRELARTLGETEARRAIMDATRAFAASPAGQRGQFTPHPATFYNAGRHLDDPAEWWAGEEVPRFEPGIYRGPQMSDDVVQELRGRIQ